jgi:hypothetical protein
MRFPEGTEAVSVHQQNFKVEVKDKDGRGYFRIPNHFAPVLVDIPGFSALDPPEGTDLKDFPPADPERDEAIERLTKQVEALRDEVSGLNLELERTRNERDSAKADVTRLSGKKAA